ncbi:MAG: hypothetical protein CMM55_06205 [Rhodospirillaceae bacterium]|nr:hypothetical protein [Rhodospirillaceae bacterium]
MPFRLFDIRLSVFVSMHHRLDRDGGFHYFEFIRQKVTRDPSVTCKRMLERHHLIAKNYSASCAVIHKRSARRQRRLIRQDAIHGDPSLF